MLSFIWMYKIIEKDKLIKLPKLNLFYMKKIKQRNEKSGQINLRTLMHFLMFIIFLSFIDPEG